MIRLSKYVRQDALTVKVRLMSGGAYGCNIDYDYGVFSGDGFVGMTYRHHKYTEIESDSDEKDGIGGMTTVRNRAAWVGEFTNGLKNGFCYELANGRYYTPRNAGIYESGRLLSTDDVIQKSQRTVEVSADEKAYCIGGSAVILKGDAQAYVGNVNEEGIPHGLGARYDAEGKIAECGNFKDGEFAGEAYAFKDWDSMPVDPVEEDGFSVLRQIDFFNDGDARMTVTEGQFAGGVLNGFGIEYYDSNVNGYHKYYTKAGLFRNGKLYFGYDSTFENTGGPHRPDSFGYVDGRSIDGEEIVYNGKKYVGETRDGVPNGIGRVYETDEKMYIGTFCDGRPFGIGATYKLIEGEWIPYDFLKDMKDRGYDYNSWGIFAEGELMPGMTPEEFFDKYIPMKKV